VTLLGLAGILVASLVGPALATVRRLRMPLVVGELLIGVVVGNTGLRWLHSSDRIFTFLAQAGFALVMLVAGTHVPVRDPRLRTALRRGALFAVGVGVLAVPVAKLLASVAQTHDVALYAVIMASSSAAIVLPIVDDERLGEGVDVLTMLAQVALADTACIIALPLAADPSHAGRAAVGAVIVLAVAGLAFLVLQELARRGLLARVHAASVRKTFGLEMRVSLAALFALAGLAITVHVSVMLAGFAFGLVLAGIGEPRRLASQLFAVTEGFLGPIFFIWLGASLDLRALAHHPRLLMLAAGLAVGTIVLHGLSRLVGQPLPLAVLACAQLGVPVAAVTLGEQNGRLQPGEGGAILAAALITVGVAAACGALASRNAAIVAAEPADGAGPPARSTVTPSRAVTPVPAQAQAPTPRLPPPSPPGRPAAQPERTAPSRPERRPAPKAARPAASRGQRTGTQTPASKPVVQSNVRIQPAPRAARPDDPIDQDREA
jgi:Kef-type K+ transport system membrane component KefB